MPVVTKISPQKKKNRVNIYLDEKFAFGLDLENYMKLGIKVGDEYSDKELNEIVKKSEFQKTSDKLINYSILRPRSKREVELWLRRKKVHESMHEDLFNKLKRLDLLDDEKFASWWVKQRLEFRNKSKRELIFELRSKGIDKNTIDDVMSKYDVDDESSAKKLILKNKHKWERYEEKDRKQKMKEYLARKGFSWEIIKKVVK
jgi:regulatory protein